MKITIEENQSSANMTCPRCFGKGFVDLLDIRRLGMKGKWGQGWCRLCDATGKVPVGLTKRVNPRRTDIGPAIHPGDIADV